MAAARPVPAAISNASDPGNGVEIGAGRSARGADWQWPRPSQTRLSTLGALAVAALSAYAYESMVTAIATFLVASILALAVASDVATRRIPNALVGRAAVVVLVASAAVVIRGEVPLGAALVRVGVAQIASGALALFVVWMIRPQLVGGGDVKMLAVVAAAIGLVSPVGAAIVGSTAALVHAGAALVTHRRSGPFAPALFVGFLAGVVFASFGAVQ